MSPLPASWRTGLVGALLSVSSLTFLSRVLGLLRDVTIAAVFAVGLHSDAFFTAFKIPNTLRRLTAEGAFTNAFVPVFNEMRALEGEEQAAGLRDVMACWLGLALLAVTILGVLGAPLLVAVLAPGFDAVEGKRALTIDLLRITFPYILLISLTAFGGAILNSFGRFAAFAFVPALLNITLIIAALVFAPLLDEPAHALAWGVIAGGVLQLGWQGAVLARHGLLPRLALPRLSPAVRRISRLTAQGTLGVAITQLGIVVSLVFASFLEQGSVTWLYFADRMMELPVGMLGATLAVIALPTLSQQSAAASPRAYSTTLDWSMRVALFASLPAAGGLGILALPVAATIFQHGSYTAHDSMQTARAIAAYSWGIPALVALRILAAGFYARQRPLIPVIIATVALSLTIALNFVLVPHMQHAGLALAIALGAIVNAGSLAWLLCANGFYEPDPRWPQYLTKLVIGLAVMMLFLLWYRDAGMAWTDMGAGKRIYQLFVCVLGGGAVYVATLHLLGWKWELLQATTPRDDSPILR